MKSILSHIILLVSLLVWTPTLVNAQADTSKHKTKPPHTESAYELPPFRAVVNPRLQLPDELGGRRVKGRINGICATDSTGNILDIKMQKLVLLDRRSGDTIAYHTFYRGEINLQNKEKLPEDAIPYFEWWHREALEATKVIPANRMYQPGVTLKPSVSDTNYVFAIYHF